MLFKGLHLVCKSMFYGKMRSGWRHINDFLTKLIANVVKDTLNVRTDDNTKA